MFRAFEFFVPWFLVPYALASVMPNWRWLLICALIGGGGFSWLWIDHWAATQRPDYNAGMGGVLGVGLFAAATIFFACGVGIRAASLFIRARGWRKSAVWIVIFGFGLPFALMEAPQALHAWQYRSAPAACIKRGFPVEIAGNRLNIPAAPTFTIYRGPSAWREAYHLFNARQVRDLCDQTGGGTQRIRARHLGISFDRLPQWKSEVCGVQSPLARRGFVPHDPPPWAAKLCAAIVPDAIMYIDPTDFPLQAHVYALPEVKLGEFGGSASTYEDSFKPPERYRDAHYTVTDSKTPDGRPLTFACRDQSDGTRWCTTSYPWMNGLHLHYAFRTRDEQYADKGRRIDEALREFLTQFLAPAT